MKHILDNPIYNSLISGHQHFAKGTEQIRYYIQDVSSFAGLKDNSLADLAALYQHSPASSTFVVFSIQPLIIPDYWKLLTHIDMFQMVYEYRELPNEELIDLVDLAQQHVPQMTALVELTQPGPFKSRTIELGNYTGIFNGNELVAMAGHRFNPTPYTEVSAVCTHPDHTGKGYAYQLLREQIKRILERSETPFLHVRNDNHGAVKLYQKLGFNIRTAMTAYVIQKL